MTPSERSDWILRLDEELLLGGVIVSEWSAFLVRSADVAFVAGADLAVVLTAQAAMESHLRYEYGRSKGGFYKLIEESPLDDDLRARLHEIRRFRNRWVHVDDPHADEDLLARPSVAETELAAVAIRAMRLMREVLYLEQAV